MSDNKIARITLLAETMVHAAAHVESLKAQLDAAKAYHRRIEQEDLPELMREIGLAEFTMTDGTKIQVTDDVECGISEERRAAAHEWLARNGFGGLIKTEVVVAFPRDAHEEAQRVADDLAQELEGIATPQVQERVHPATLKAFIKEQLAAGKPVPFDLFGVHPFSKAKLVSSSRKQRG
jgi:hypothetical protein